MMDRTTLKEYAKSRVSGQRVEIWKALIFLYLGSMLISVFLPTIDYATLTSTHITQSDNIQFIRIAIISSLITTLLLQPLTYGINQSLMNFDKENYIHNNTIFASYKKILKIFVLSVFITIVSALPMIIITTVCVLIQTSYTTILFAIILGGIANIFISYLYVAVPYLFNDMQDASIIEIMSTSRKMMKGHKLEFFVLGLSFIGWDLLAMLSCGLFIIWLAPYIVFTNAKYFLDLKNDYFNHLVEVNEKADHENS